jgi:hypothetical protein
VTAHACSAQEAGALHLLQDTPEDVVMSNSLFLRNHAGFFGMMHRVGKSLLSMTSINNSDSRGDDCVGLFEVKTGTVELKYSVTDNSSASCHNGGICTRLLDAFTVDHCLFFRCHHNTKEKDTGAVFLVYENPYDSSVVHSNFIQNEPNGSFTITVASGHGLAFANCCFSGSESRELRERNYVIENCSFQETECKPVVSAVDYGYGSKQSKVKAKPKRALRDRRVAPAPWRRNALVLVASGIMSVLLAGVLTIVQRYVRKVLKDKRKQPRAIQ